MSEPQPVLPLCNTEDETYNSEAGTEAISAGDKEVPEANAGASSSSHASEVETSANDRGVGDRRKEKSVESVTESPSLGDSTSTLSVSKRQMKRELRQARKKEWIRQRRPEEKKRKKAKRAAIREAGGVLPKRVKPNIMMESQCKQRVAIDMSFGAVMSARDIGRTLQQLEYCYAANRRAKNPLQLTFAKFDDFFFDTFYSNETHCGWDVNIDERPLELIYPVDQIVYLTADSENLLEALDDSKVYVIGGLLDHNSLPGHCLKTAISNGMAHARLPIEKFVKLTTRKVLTINQVFEILLRFTETHSWEDAFFSIIPPRKLKDAVRVSTNGKEHEGEEKTEEAGAEEAGDAGGDREVVADSTANEDGPSDLQGRRECSQTERTGPIEESSVNGDKLDSGERDKLTDIAKEKSHASDSEAADVSGLSGKEQE